MSVPKPDGPLGLALFISGSGRTLKNLIERIEAGRLTAQIRLVIASTPRAGGLQFARQGGIPHHAVRPEDFATVEAYSDAMFELCRQADVDLVVLGGFLKRITVPGDFCGRVVNIHPALVPAFCGHGFYGRFVHEAVLDYGAKLTGCTVHFVDDQYDHGPVILQKAVAVAEDDTPEVLAARVFQTECEALPEALQWIAEGRVTLDGRRVRVAKQ